MKLKDIVKPIGVLFGALLSGAVLADGVAVEGISCRNPEYHCPDANCSGEMIAQRGNVTDVLTGRNYFLDYPCDLQKGEDVMFVLNLHGGGSIANWQRHYFPIFDFKDKYRIIVATPSGVVRAWMPDNDDGHLENIVNYVYQKFSDVNIKSFWLAGHSQGGQTSNRLIMEKDFIKEHLTGWVSIAGGRLGSERGEIRAAIPRGTPPPSVNANNGDAPPRPPGLVAYAEVLPEYSFSHIYTSGQHEIPKEKNLQLPKDSPWASKLGCDARVRRDNVVDTKAGYVYDSRRQENRNKIWGLDPRPGTAEVYEFPNCDDGHIVVDIVRLDKGHTEGLEPNVTEAIIKLMLSAGK